MIANTIEGRKQPCCKQEQQFRIFRCPIRMERYAEKKTAGKVSMGVVRTTYLINENGIIVKAFDKVKAADNPAQMLEILKE